MQARTSLSHHGDRKGRDGSRKTGPVNTRKPIKECRTDRPTVTIRFRCGCALILKDKQVFLRLQKDPAPGTGKRMRLLGFIHEGVFKMFRRGTDFLRVRNCYGINVHLLDNAATLGFTRIYCDTPRRGGFLPDIDRLLQRTAFSYASSGFENQVGFAIDEIKAAA